MSLGNNSTASKYTEQLDKMYVQKAVTGFLADNALRAKFVGAKTVMIPNIEFEGLVNYDRDEGFTKGATTVNHVPFTLTKDRGRTLQIDREDMDETGVASLAGQVLSEYIRTQVVPETDAYVLSTLYAKAKAAHVANDLHITKYTESSAVKDLLNTINNAQNAAGYDEELVAFVNPTLYSVLMTSAELSRQVITSDFKQGELNLKVKSINGVSIIPVTTDRMKSEYTFATSGTGGFNATSAAKNIYAIVMPKKGASLVRKTETLRVFTPEQNLNADAYKFDYRIYYDLLVKESNKKKIFAISDETITLS